MSNDKKLMKKKILAVAGVILFIIAAVLLFCLWGPEIIKFVSEPEKFRAWVDEMGFAARLGYMGMVIVQVIVAIIPGEPFEIAAGYAFGAWEGTILCLIATALGSIMVFGLVRIFGMRVVRLFFSEEQINSISFLKTSPKRTMLYLIIYMIPGTPKDLLSYFAGLTDMKLPVWLLMCSVGRIPSVITSTIGGNLLGTENYLFAAIVFVVTFLICVGGILIYNKMRENNK